MFTMAMPPVIQPTSELARSISFSEMPPLPIRQPIVMKNGTAIREKELIVPMDATLIEQVLINLFDNVSAHGKSATRIWLDIACRPGRAILRVEDDGIGIPAQQLPGLFDGSARHGSQERPDVRRSMGIGLSVCRTIVRAHGGDMKADRSPRGGAAVTFYLPCDAEQVLLDSEEDNGQ